MGFQHWIWVISLHNRDLNSRLHHKCFHGENIYDEGGNLGHDYAGKLPKSNVEIPFVIWGSDHYRKNNSAMLDLMRTRKSTPYVTDHLFHTLIDLAKINSAVFVPEKSLVNSRFDSTRKRILEDGFDYDE